MAFEGRKLPVQILHGHFSDATTGTWAGSLSVFICETGVLTAFLVGPRRADWPVESGMVLAWLAPRGSGQLKGPDMRLHLVLSLNSACWTFIEHLLWAGAAVQVPRRPGSQIGGGQGADSE